MENDVSTVILYTNVPQLPEAPPRRKDPIVAVEAGSPQAPLCAILQYQMHKNR
jgi:hypothetical protein